MITDVRELPIERQREIASEEGLTLEQWHAKLAELDKKADALRAELDANRVRLEDLPPEEQEAWKRFQARVDDEVYTNAVIQRRREADSGNP